ncbi:unnamed protein product [Rotaria magnacalcarata]
MTSTRTTYSFTINHLPEDVLTFTGEKFHNFVKELLGESTADLLTIQAINNVPSFLLSDNIDDVVEFGADSEEMKALREKVSFAFRDGTYHVKLEEENKKIRNLQKITKKTNSISSILREEINPTSQPLATTINSTSPASSTKEINPTSPSLTTEINPVSQQLSTTIIPTSPKPLNVINSRSPPLMTKDDHVEFLLNLMKKWTEYIDYTINITFNNNVVEGVVNCKCGVQIKLRTRNEKKRQYDEQNQLPIDINSNDRNKNMNDNRRTASQKPLSEITTNTSTSQRHQTDIIVLSTTNSAKRNSSNSRAASSQQSSAKRHER